MIRQQPTLELEDAHPLFESSALPNAPLSLQAMPGECTLIETHNAERMAALADLSSGMLPLRSGAVRCMGFDWSELAPERADALRGRIGRLHQRNAWAGMLPTHVDIMLPQLHHTRTPEAVIAQSALALARALGLPGLPLVRPDRLSEGDLIRAGCVRAFLGEPRLLLLESAFGAEHAELFKPFFSLLSQALAGGASAVCFTREPAIWREQAFPVRRHWLLSEHGLSPAAGG